MVFDNGAFAIPPSSVLRLKGDGLPKEVVAVMLPDQTKNKDDEASQSARKVSRAFSFEGIPDKDNMPITLNLILQMQLIEPLQFFLNVFKANTTDQFTYVGAPDQRKVIGISGLALTFSGSLIHDQRLPAQKLPAHFGEYAGQRRHH